jgi:hypothetical protein
MSTFVGILIVEIVQQETVQTKMDALGVLIVLRLAPMIKYGTGDLRVVNGGTFVITI